MISLHLIPMDKEGNLIPFSRGIMSHEWRGEDGRGFYSVDDALSAYINATPPGFSVIAGISYQCKVPAGNTLAAVVNTGGSFHSNGQNYAAIVGHFDDPADSTDYFEDAPIVAQDAQDGQGEGK